MGVTAGGTYFSSIGHRDRPTLLLIHGLGLCHEIWEHQATSLSQNYHVVTYDLLGHGQSATATQPPSLDVFSNQITELLDALEIPRAALVGFSLGGMIAREFAQRRPKRVLALGILHSAHKRDEAAQASIRARVQQAKTQGPAATVDAALERWFTDAYRDSRPDQMNRVRNWIMGNGKAIYHQNYSVLAEGVAEIISPDPAITAPTLVVTADEDFGNSPEMSQAIAQEIPGAELHVLKGLRHMALMEAPEITTELLVRFFNKHLE